MRCCWNARPVIYTGCIYNFWTNLKTRFFTSKQRMSLCKHTPRYVGFLSLTEMSHSQIKAVTVFHFTYNWRNTLTIHVSNLIIVEFFLFLQSQSKEDVQNILYLNKRTHRHVWSWNLAHFPRSRDGFECFDRRQRGVRGASSFSIGAEYSMVLKSHHIQKCKGMWSTHFWAVPLKLSVYRHTLICTFFSF